MDRAILYGIISGVAIVIGAVLALSVRLNNRLIASFMAFGAGVLISALSIDLISDAFERSQSPVIVAIGFLLGALAFVFGDYIIDSKGGHYRKHGHGVSEKQKSGGTKENSGMAILLGTLLDGIPESFVLGAAIASGGSGGLVFVAAICLSNIPEGMSGTVGMKEAGMSNRDIMMLWGVTFLVTLLSTICGYVFLGGAPVIFHAATLSFASGAILAMLCDTMIPEAFKFGGRFVALITVVGFLLAFLLSKMA